MKPRFYCENCGREVPANALRCPYCKRTFTSVRCPGCGFEGRTEDFAGGCPVCGHSAPAEAAARGGQRGPTRLPEGGGSRRGLPPAFYRAAAVVLAAGIVALLVVLLLRG